MMQPRTVSVDDLLDTLTVIARLAEKGYTRTSECEHHAHKAFRQIKEEALDAIERAEKGER